MATTKKKSSSTRSKSGSTGRNSSTKNKIERQRVYTVPIIIIALSIIVFITNFGVGGAVGKGISSFFFGMFGLTAYIFPILLIVGTIFAINNKTSFVVVKLLESFAILVLLCTFIQLCAGDHAKEWSVSQYYLNSSATKLGGGLLGGMLCKLFVTWFARVGAFIFVIALLIIVVSFIIEHSIIKLIANGFKSLFSNTKQGIDEYREDAEVRQREREEKRLKRAQEKRTGVTFDTEVTDTTPDPVEEFPPKEESPVVEKKIRGAKKSDPVEFERDDAVAASMSEVSPVSPVSAMPSTSEPEVDYSLPIRQDESVKSFSDSYRNAEDVTDSVTRMNNDPETDHYIEEQIDNGDPYPEEEIIIDTSDNEEPIEDDIIDTELVSEEFAKEEAGRKSISHTGGSDIDRLLERAELDKEDALAEDVIPDTSFTPPAAPKKAAPRKKAYKFPPLNLLNRNTEKTDVDQNELNDTAKKLQSVLGNFGVSVDIGEPSRGPSVTRYEIIPKQGVKVSKIVSLADDIKLNLAAADIRIEAPIPGKSAVGIEVPNRVNESVLLGDIISSSEFKKEKSLISFGIGKDIAGKNVCADISKMPHALVAGTTGSGKSVCLNSIILSILYKAKPDEVKFIMVDPKMVEFAAYNGIPHLLSPVVTDPKKAAGALAWAVAEMDDRYRKFAEVGAKDIGSYNNKIAALPDEAGDKPDKMFQIVIIVDELADLMMTAGKEVENYIVRLAQKARACGIHLVLATQKPTVDVVTGLIKSNVPTRIALTVASQMDSRVMLDENGADKLLGHGDMLFLTPGKPKPDRLQGPFVSEAEIEAVVNYIKDNNPDYCVSVKPPEFMVISKEADGKATVEGANSSNVDPLFADAGKLIIDKGRCSIGMLQRALQVGFNRAARIVDQLCDAGVVGPEEGTKPRKVLMDMTQFDELLKTL